MLLVSVKHAINGAKFKFRVAVSSRLSDFTDNPMLLAHLEEELLPICNACRSYEFAIIWPSNYTDTVTYTDTSAVTNTITTILQFGPIDGCSEVLFDLYCKYFDTELPVMSIVNWLNRGPNTDTLNTNGQVMEERVLQIKSYSILNLLALVNGLKKVNFNYFCHKK